MNNETLQTSPAPATPPATTPWYQGVTGYQWMVLAIASAGWIFDIFEGQVIVAVGNKVLPDLLRDTGLEDEKELIFNVSLAAFLAGGAVGGVLFGMLADRWGRKRVMSLTILMYSAFMGLTYFVQNWWQLSILRFLVGMGVGGEWAVAAAVVAEVFPLRARPAASGIFHASSVLGTYLAVAASLFLVVGNKGDEWRYAFLLGVLPALLILWVRAGMREPETWETARDHSRQLGSLRELFTVPVLRRHALVGMGLAVIGLATFWAADIRGKDLLRGAVVEEQKAAGIVDEEVQDHYDMLGMFLVTTGGGLGLLSFAPVSQRLGRRPAFVLFHVGAFTLVVLVCLVAASVPALLIVLPVFGFFTLGMHAGYAVYFPELFPTRLRGTGAGVCFNMARVVACPVLLGFGWLHSGPLKMDLPGRMLLLGSLFLAGAVLIQFGPETRGQPLPE